MRTSPLVNALPGLAVLALLAVGAAHVAAAVPGVNALVLAVVFGAVVANVVGTPDWAEAGVGTHKLLLETGIVLLGARLALDEVVASGPRIVGLVLVTVGVGLLVVELLGRRVFDLPQRTSSLLAAGSSICGVSAVVAVAGAIDADGEEVTYAAATVLLFDAVTLLTFPLVGATLGLTGQEFGVWAGLSMFSTGPVAAAGFAYSATAGQWATVTKVTRNALIGLVAVGYSLRYARQEAGPSGSADGVWAAFPKFLVGFLFVVVLANTGVFSASTLASLEQVSDWLFALAFVGLGFDIRLSRMRETGATPVLVVCCYLAFVAAGALLAVTTLL